MTIRCLIVPVIVLERAAVAVAFQRSRDLVRGFGWQVFGTLVLVWLLLILTNLVITAVLAPLPDAAQQVISSIVSGTLISPFLALVLTLGYFRLRAAHIRPGWSGSIPD